MVFSSLYHKTSFQSLNQVKYAQTSKFLFCSPSLRNKLFVAYLMNHSALRVSAMKINTPAATQISVGFVFLEGFS